MWDSVSLPTINLLSKLGLTVQSNLQRCLYNQGLILRLSLLLELTFLNLNAKSILLPLLHWLNHAQFKSNLDFPNQRLNRKCLGCNHQGCNRSNLVMARYARPRSHIPQCCPPPGGHLVTGWQVSTHWVTGCITTHCHPSSQTSSFAVLFLHRKK